MIKIHKNDSIIDIIIKITHCKEKQIVLDFPFWHPVLHNATSLKIIKTKADKKELVIITSDQTAKLIAQRLGIKYSLIHNSDILKYNYSFLEYSKVLFFNYINEIKNLFRKSKGYENFDDYKNRYFKQKTRIWFFLIGLWISFLLLVFIFYFAVNKTYIYITPEITVKNKARNITFQELEDTYTIENDNVIRLKKIEKLVYLEEVFGTSWVANSNIQKSRGTVTLKNKLTEFIDLRPKSRLQAPNGSIFFISSGVRIPSATYSSSGSIIPGSIDVAIESSTHDINGEIVWDKANLEAEVFLFFPGLADEKKNIFAHTKTLITWADNKYTKTLGKDDVKNAKKILENKLKSYALVEVKKFIKQWNQTNNVEYKLLSEHQSVLYSWLNIAWDTNLKLGEELKDFKLSGSLKIVAFTYNSESVLNKLKNTVQDGLLDEIENILYINDDSLRIGHKVYQNKKSPYTLKATVQVEAFYTHNFLSKKNNYVQKLKWFIQSTPVVDAEKLLINNPKISNVEIEVQPFFMKKVSSIPDNIIFKIIEK